jgi:hypothetical protein
MAIPIGRQRWPQSSWRGALQQRREGGLADVERLAPQVVAAIQFDQVEGVQEHAAVVAAVPDTIEARHAVVVTAHRLAMQEPERSCASALTMRGKRSVRSLPGRL